MEVRLSIDDAFLKDLQEKIGGSPHPSELTRDALTMFNWAVQEVAAGRVLLSTSAAGEDLHRLVMPTLTQVAQRAKQRARAADEKNPERAVQS
jgi:hypothetical protein